MAQSVKDVATRDKDEIQSTDARRNAESALRPPCDISEDADSIVVRMDMPGVSSDRLSIHTNKDSLLVEGQAQIDMPEGMEALYADVRSTSYRRSFALSRDLDREKIEAKLKDGVLTLRIPKRDEVRPRKIQVRTD